jgi:molybdenum cofactor biosynthesis enzyme MoaA
MVIDRSEGSLAAMEAVIKANSAIANISRLPPENNFVERYEFPRRVLLEMTSKCNVLCRMCPRNDFHRPEIHMNFDVYCRILDEINDHGAEGVWIYHLGESLMHPQFRKIIRYTERLNNIGKLWMSTNGHLMKRSNLEFVFDSRIDYLNYSLHAVTEKAFKAVSPRGDFYLVLQNYENLEKSSKATVWKRRLFIYR